MIPALSQTYSGAFFDFQDPEGTIDAIPFYDIAYALGNIPRFGGHAYRWSVLQHSVLVAHLCPAPLKRAGLMHDAHEAFVGDVQTPMKQLLPDYKALENRVQDALLRRFTLSREEIDAVKPYDLRALYIETRLALPKPPEPTGAWACLDRQPTLSTSDKDRFEFIRNNIICANDFLNVYPLYL